MLATHRVVERDFIVERVFRAPPAAVFAAWTDPASLARWWGPATFTNHDVHMDARPGGSWRLVMRSPDGVDLPLFGAIVEVDAPNRLVMTARTDEQPREWHRSRRAERGGSR